MVFFSLTYFFSVMAEKNDTPILKEIAHDVRNNLIPKNALTYRHFLIHEFGS